MEVENANTFETSYLIQWTPLDVITFVNTKNDNNNRLITLTEKIKFAILSFIRCRKNKII